MATEFPEAPRGREPGARRARVDGLAGAVSDKVRTKLAAQAARQQETAARHEELARRAAKKSEALDRVATTLGSLDVWLRAEPHGRRPRFRREEIIAAAMRIADAEGFAAVSMRRIADELGAGTMTLYHYVRTKDELLTLLVDAIMAEVVIPDDAVVPDDWRDALVLIATRSRAALLRHPWVLDIADDPPLGPNSVRHFDQTLRAVAGLGLDLADQLDIVSAVDEYVFGYCLHERANTTSGSADGWRDPHLVAYVQALVASGAYPHLAERARATGLDAVWTALAAHHRDTSRFERNLRRLLDGFAADLDRTGGRPRRARPTRT